MSLINGTSLTFTDISSEIRRTYVFPGGNKVVIEKPNNLHVSENGHRILDAANVAHYVPKGWIHLYWETKLGAPQFVK
jgi:hypothetical protein